MVQGISVEGSTNTTNHLSQSQQYYYTMQGLLKGEKKLQQRAKCRKEKEYTENNFLIKIK